MEALVVALRVVSAVVVVDAALAFAFGPTSAVRAWTGRLVEPLYRPVHWVVDPQRVGLDYAPMVVVMALVALAFAVAPEAVAGP